MWYVKIRRKIAMYYGYMRVSTKNRGQDLETQRLCLADWFNKNKITKYKEIAFEISAKKDLGVRGIWNLLDEVKTGDVLVCTEISRLSRKMLDTQEIIEALLKKKVELICIKQNIHLTNENKMITGLILNIVGSIAQFETELMSSRIKMGLERARKNGKKLGNPRIGLTNKKRQEESTEFVKKLQPIFTMMRESKFTLNKMANYLNKIGIKTFTGEGKWSVTQCHRYLNKIIALEK
ncbi:recombinase family protein [Solidesulfovibrio alcoholivorans]|uniref:recombinase family protein n=1 Tax=Solidesulfovibrio alcoholivorans TaxID=81406 RepID=UPI0009FEB47E